MKYYGDIYKGIVGTYNTQEMQSFEDPYDALRSANVVWDSNPDRQIARLLIVIRKSDLFYEESENDSAYFQFTDSKSCEVFIEKRRSIVWSTSEKQEWNGNAQMM